MDDGGPPGRVPRAPPRDGSASTFVAPVRSAIDVAASAENDDVVITGLYQMPRTMPADDFRSLSLEAMTPSELRRLLTAYQWTDWNRTGTDVIEPEPVSSEPASDEDAWVRPSQVTPARSTGCSRPDAARQGTGWVAQASGSDGHAGGAAIERKAGSVASRRSVVPYRCQRCANGAEFLGASGIGVVRVR